MSGGNRRADLFLGIDASLIADLWIRPTRRLAALAGVVLILALGFTEGTSTSDHLANLALAVLLLASVAALAEAIAARRQARQHESLLIGAPGSSNAWAASFGVTAVASIVAVQTWFRVDTSIAGGDIGPPDGVAWIDRIFAPWSWSGFDLGSPSTLETQLPWAVIAGLIHSVGGSAAIAQRVWYTALFAASALGAVLLLRTLGAGPLPAVIGAAVYVLNPYVVSTVGTSPVFMSALALAVLLPTCVLAAASSKISVRAAAVLIGISSPFLGYAYSNPPLVGMLVALLLASPLIVWWIWGPKAANRAWRATLLGCGLLVVVSAYWIVPAVIQVHTSAVGRLSAQASWTWTEARATVGNAFWLNTSWAWSSQYYPFADAYSAAPLSFWKYVLPAMAFAALWAVDRRTRDGSLPVNRLGLPAVSLVSIVTLLVLVMSTGTRPPGNLLFDPLYRLPLGWLLREPARFLLLAGLGYSILVAAFATRLLSVDFSRGATFMRKVPLVPVAVALLGAAITLGIGFPMVTGAVVPDARSGLPSMHVHLPSDWLNMAEFVDIAPYEGALVVLPPDDFYQMPYRWGYYGTDGFIPYLMKRRVIVPNNQGYFSGSENLVSSVNLITSSLLDRNWSQADLVLRSLRAPLILVRGDINPAFPGRSIVAPAAISIALRQAPSFVLIHKAGPLELFASVRALSPWLDVTRSFATVDSGNPDLRLLTLLPVGTALVSSPALPGIARLSQIPPPDEWHVWSGQLRIQIAEPAGWHYSLAIVDSGGVSRRIDPLREPHALSPYIIAQTQDPNTSGIALEIGLSTQSELPTSRLILVGDPDYSAASSTQLIVLHEGYSNDWSGPTGAQHVVVDGIMNGWLIAVSQPVGHVEYIPTRSILLGFWISSAGVVILVALAIRVIGITRLAALGHGRPNA